MATVANLPRTSRLERAVLVLAFVPVGLGGGALVCRVLRVDWSGQAWPGARQMGWVVCAVLVALGVVMAARALGKPKVGWVGLIAVFGGAWNFQDPQASPVSASCLVLAGAVFTWGSIRGASRARLFIEAMAGSAIAAISGSVFIGYAADLPAIYGWGAAPIAQGTAIGLLFTGLGLIGLAWVERSREMGVPPRWAPIPAAIAGLMLTLTLWMGLRDREAASFQARASQVAASLASAMDRAIDDERAAMQRLARAGTDAGDAVSQFESSVPDGCVSIARLDASGRTQTVYPQEGNEDLLGYDQRSSLVRREAMDHSGGDQGGVQAQVSATTDIRGRSQSGFVIFAPMQRGGKLTGWVAAEYQYGPLLRDLIERELKLGDEYHVAASIGPKLEYAGGGADPEAGARLAVERTVTVYDRPLVLEITPADPLRLRDLRSLPAFALLAGLGLTALFSLSVQLARRARAGQLAAEDSNQRLLRENEERRRVESRLKLSDERLRLALDSTEIGIFEWNVPSGHVFYSAGLWGMLGHDAGRMESNAGSWLGLIHPDDAATFRARLEDQLRGSSAFLELEHRVRTGSGEWRWVYTRAKVVSSDSDGRPNRLIGTVQDVTARVETEHQLRRAKAEADAASRSKTEFLASMSHEIRTPMNGIIGMTSLIMDTALTEEQRDYVGTIRASSEALLTIVNDILDFSKIESGKMEIERAPFGLALCLEETLELFAAPAAEKNIEIGYSLAADVPAWIYGDARRLWQVVTNLLNNAVKFTSGGAVAIEVRRLGDAPEGRIVLEFAVRDTGIGIPPERMGRLFKAFSQVDSSTTRRFGGTGLGLAICERLCHLMGGTIRVESTVGEGSAFIFTIQAEEAPTPPEVEPPPAVPEPLREGVVAIALSHPVARKRLRELFERWGARCAYVDELPPERVPALIVLENPAERGPGGCPRLYVLPFGKTLPPQQDGTLAEAIAKPVKTAATMQAVIRLFERRKVNAPAAETTGATLLAKEVPLRVLLAEDNTVNQKVALGLLERLGYRADLAANGRQAFAMMRANGYDLILMDLQMPEMDGLEASREIRRCSELEKQPRIIALTANAMHGDKELCLAAGMDDYIAKPVKLTEVAAAIRRQFKR